MLSFPDPDIGDTDGWDDDETSLTKSASTSEMASAVADAASGP